MEFQDSTGKFRVIKQGSISWLAFEPTGEDLATYEGEILVLEFKESIPDEDLNDIAQKFNTHLHRAVIKDLNG